MISSPCLSCRKKNKPKNDCIEKCKIIKEVQEFQVSLEEEDPWIFQAIDYAEEGRYIINPVEIQ